MAGEKRDYRSSDDLRIQVGKLEADQRNVRGEVQTLRQYMERGFQEIREYLEELSKRTERQPVDPKVIGVACTMLILIISPLVWTMLKNFQWNEVQDKEIDAALVAVAELQRDRHWQQHIMETFIMPELKELSDQQRGAVKTALDMHSKAMAEIKQLRDEVVKGDN